MDISLKRKYAVICGSSQGIGLAAAKELALNGANCILIARNPEALAGAVKQLSKQGEQAHRWMAADFSDPNMVEKTIQSIVGKNRLKFSLIIQEDRMLRRFSTHRLIYLN